MGNKISSYQLLSAMFIIPYGTAILYYLAPEAEHDSWFAILFYTIPAIILILTHIKLSEFYPNDTLVTYMPKIFGKFIGTLISIIYVLYFIYMSARVLRDFSGLIVSSSMRQTPSMFVAALLMLTVIYGVIVGIETLFRASELLFPMMLFGLLLAILLLIVTKGIIKPNKLLPIFQNGILFPIKKSFRLITFPYGELIAFTMIYKNINEPQKTKKIAVLAIIIEGIALSVINIIFITSLGITFSSISVFPLLETLRLIKIGGFLERLDILIIVTMVTAGFMKISFFMYFGVLGITEIFKLKGRKTLCIILGIVIWISSELIAGNFPEHLKIGLDFTFKYIHIPLQIGIPILAFIIAWFKNKNSQASAN